MSIEGKSANMVTGDKKVELELQIEKLRNDLVSRKNDSVTVGSFSGLGNDNLSGGTFNFNSGSTQSIEQQLAELENQKRAIEEDEQRKLDESIAMNKLKEELEINKQISEDVEVNRQKIETEKKEEAERIERKRLENEERISKMREENKQKINSLKESIKSYEEEIDSIEKGGKFKISKVINKGVVEENSIDDLHNKIIETEKQIRELENLNFENDASKNLLSVDKFENTNRAKNQEENILLNEKDQKIRDVLQKLDELSVEYEVELQKFSEKQNKSGIIGRFSRMVLRQNKEPKSLINARNAYLRAKEEYFNLIEK